MQNYSISPLSMLTSVWIHRHLIWNLTYREILGRYKGSLLGILWSLIIPILMLLIYTFVFQTVFNANWKGKSDNSVGNFALILFIGLIIYTLFAESVIKAPTLIISNVNFVKKIIFPLEILPIVTISVSIFHLCISMLVWLSGYIFVNGMPPTTTLLLPLIIAPLVLFTAGLCWILASLGVYLRDISQVINLVCQALLFMTPIFYPVSALPIKYQWIIQINPLTTIIEMARGCLITGTYPNFFIILNAYLISMVIAWLGYAWFQKTRKGFADVL